MWGERQDEDEEEKEEEEKMRGKERKRHCIHRFRCLLEASASLGVFSTIWGIHIQRRSAEKDRGIINFRSIS